MITTGTSCRRSACRTAAGWRRPTTMARPGSRTARSLRPPRRHSPPSRRTSIAGLRSDAAVGCAPRRKDLPVRATAGIECRLNSDPVARFGAYRFRDARDAALTYLERLGLERRRPGERRLLRRTERRLAVDARRRDDRQRGGSSRLRRQRSMGRRPERLLSRRGRHGQCQADLRIDVHRHRRTERGPRGAP